MRAFALCFVKLCESWPSFKMSSSSNSSSSSSESEVEDSFNEESVECCGIVAHMTSLPKGLI